ncbi:transcription factor-like 5 protein isoform X2 [Parambassis ranga]|nr:transcription factor-like 5 protein isoform X2 [Parambassis ranga]
MEAISHPATVMAAENISPPTQPIDMSFLSDDECLVMPREKTPTLFGEVPDSVLAKIRGEENQSSSPAKGTTSSQRRPLPAARVCLEKRFNTMSAVTPSFLTILQQQSAEDQEVIMRPQKQKWIKTDREHHLCYIFEPVEFGQVISHVVEPNNHRSLIIPNRVSLSLHPVPKDHDSGGGSLADERQLVKNEKELVPPAVSMNYCCTQTSHPTTKAAAAAQKSQSSARRTRHVLFGQRKERHNSRERERRKRIRLYCDQLNMMVPFCRSDTDKVNTLQRTTAFLKWIQKRYGDALNEEFEKTHFKDDGEVGLESSFSSDQDAVNQDMDKTLSLGFGAEQ